MIGSVLEFSAVALIVAVTLVVFGALTAALVLGVAEAVRRRGERG